MGFRTSRFWFPATPLSCYPNYRALTFALAGLSPAEHTSLSWLQPPHQLISGRGEPPVPRSLMQHARAQGSKGDGTILRRGVLQPCLVAGHTSALESVMFLSSSFSESHHSFRAALSGTRPVSR